MTVADQFFQLPLLFFWSSVCRNIKLSLFFFSILNRITFSYQLWLTSPSSATLNQRGALCQICTAFTLYLWGFHYANVIQRCWRVTRGLQQSCSAICSVLGVRECARVRKRRRLQHCLLYILSHGQIAKQKGRLAGGHTLPSSGLHCRWYAENAVLCRCRLFSCNKVIKHAQVPCKQWV